MATTGKPLGYGGQLIADVFMVLYEADHDERWIHGAEACALALVFGRVSEATLPEYIAGIVSGLKEDRWRTSTSSTQT